MDAWTKIKLPSPDRNGRCSSNTAGRKKATFHENGNDFRRNIVLGRVFSDQTRGQMIKWVSGNDLQRKCHKDSQSGFAYIVFLVRRCHPLRCVQSVLIR